MYINSDDFKLEFRFEAYRLIKEKKIGLIMFQWNILVFSFMSLMHSDETTQPSVERCKMNYVDKRRKLTNLTLEHF